MREAISLIEKDPLSEFKENFILGNTFVRRVRDCVSKHIVSTIPFLRSFRTHSYPIYPTRPLFGNPRILRILYSPNKGV